MNKNKEWGKADWSKVTTQVANEYGCFVGMADINKFISWNCEKIAKKSGKSYQDVVNVVKQRNGQFFEEAYKLFGQFDGVSKDNEDFRRLKNLFELPIIA